MRARHLAPVLLLTAATAQQARRPQTTHPATQKNPAQTTPTTSLPITRVALYKNGVGFFEHSGRVSGDQAVTIDFTSAQLNDVLQSLTAIDLSGGRITGAGYNSTTPLEQQLKTLPLGLSDDPSDVDFYNAIRGARVTVHAPGADITGRLLSIDLRPDIKKSDADDSSTQPNRRFLTVVSDTGQVRTIELTQGVSVTLVDTALHTDVTRYLELIANARNQGLRHLTLTDRGTGNRDLRVSYISEVPVWKSTYRILFTDIRGMQFNGAIPPTSTLSSASTATIQGWSVVDNTTGSDWVNVHLDLIAGAPQSFIQPLSTPYYTRRVEVPLPSEAQMEPQTFESGSIAVDGDSNASATVLKGKDLDALKRDRSVGGGLEQLGRPQPRAAQGVAGGVGYGYGAGVAQTVTVNAMGGRIALAPAPPIDYADAAEASLTPQTTTAAFDDFFQYSLTDPITIRKNESALVPILQTKLPIERVTLWSVQQPQALRALWITNSSNLTLDRGSFSIVENGAFGGEGLLDPIHPNERRLLSYAADQAVRVTPGRDDNSRTVTHIRIQNGVLRQSLNYVEERSYVVRNAAPEPRTVVLESPVLPGYTLDSTPKPDETTPTVYRFKLAALPNTPVTLKTAQRKVGYESFRLIDQDEDQLLLILRNAHASPALLAQLQPVFGAHHAVIALDKQIADRQNEINTITQDQNRLRENMKALKGSPEERALLTRYTGELNTQEDSLARLNKEIADLRTQRIAADQDFNNKLNAIQIDENI